MRLKDTSALYSRAYSQQRAIAFFRLPGTGQVRNIEGVVTHRLPKGQEAFAFAPFDTAGKIYYIKPSAKLSVKAVDTLRKEKIKSTSKKAFKDYVKKIEAEIKASTYQKVVAARVFAADRPVDFSPALFFDKLCTAYPNAFVSLTYIPGVGLWIGASPEVLASQNATALTTYALAGTKAIDDNTAWTDKEKTEQSIVTDFIHQKLSKISDADIKTKGPLTYEVGSLKHLLTVFTVRSTDTDMWPKVAKALHPTPAVGGMPQAKSVKFIREQETFERKFYAGYLGPVNRKGKTGLYVNLRCMEVTDKQLLFYAGCGITADSDPEQEWLESERKIDVLRKLCLTT